MALILSLEWLYQMVRITLIRLDPAWYCPLCAGRLGR